MTTNPTEKMRRWRKNNPEKAVLHQKNQKLRNRQRKAYLVSLLGGKCIKCGYDKSVMALHFHHTNPNEKEGHISFFGFDKQIEEVKKCILLCANCHAETHEELENN